MRAIAIVALMLSASLSWAQGGVAPSTNVTPYYLPTGGTVAGAAPTGSLSLLSGAALNATASARTIIINTAKRVSKLDADVLYTYSAATTVTAAMTCSKDGTNYISRTTSSCSSGTCTHYLMTDTYTTGAASANLTFEWDVRGCEKVKVVFGGASAGAGDLVTVNAQGVTGL